MMDRRFTRAVGHVAGADPVFLQMAHSVTAFIVVAIAGLAFPLHARTRKLLSHCGVTLVEIPWHPDALNELRRKVRVDAVVLDARVLSPSTREAPEFVALTSCGRSESDDRPLAVVVLGDRRVPVWVRAVCERVGARFLSTKPQGPNYAQLIRILRDMCGLSTCCKPSPHHEGNEVDR
jgi:hypothetical protein